MPAPVVAHQEALNVAFYAGSELAAGLRDAPNAFNHASAEKKRTEIAGGRINCDYCHGFR